MDKYRVLVSNGGGIAWHLNNKLHRDGYPAIEFINGYKVWYLHGNLHRVDGPAVIYQDGKVSWWLAGEWMKKEEHQRRTPNG